ncbi:hypothetical protein DFP72DRAFT_1072722 [Ephemerocybe angulata]|uniref:Uncharacterized protein n=1 Tax=Ephemerocybe angulata TaxID=980116 RepID=A0A8H6M3E2_9AGAR|nr:hypothetical protein DFP72DRAFT_1072722 [Tulosesus angulatus]
MSYRTHTRHNSRELAHASPHVPAPFTLQLAPISAPPTPIALVADPALQPISSRSPLLYTLKFTDYYYYKEQNDLPLYTLNHNLVNALEWSCQGLVSSTIEAVAGPTGTAYMNNLPDHVFAEIGMERPALMNPANRFAINPLRGFGTHEALTELFQRQQRWGLEMAQWMLDAREAARAKGPGGCSWLWDRVDLPQLAPSVAPAPAPQAEIIEISSDSEDSEDDTDGGDWE